MTARLAAAVATLAGLAAGAPAAQAAFLPPDVADGPSADILSLGGAEISADGTGGLAYLKREGGVPHVFVSRLDKGRPLPSVRVDVGQGGEASDLRYAASEEFGGVVLWRSGGALWAARRGAGPDEPWGPPQVVYDGPIPATDPDLDASLAGTAYASFTVAGDVRVARMTWQENAWTLLPQPVDIDPARIAGDADIAVAADGTALVAWVETGLDTVSHVWARRINYGGQLSNHPREVSVPSFEDRPGGSADSPSVDIQDDSTYGFIVIRQDFVDAGVTVSRTIGRRMVASSIEDPQAVDSLAFPTVDGADPPYVEVSGRGRGMSVTPLRSGAAIAGVIRRREPLGATWRRGVRLDAGSPPPSPQMTATMSEGEEGVAAWQQGGAGLPTLRARHFVAGSGFEPEITLSVPEFGQVEGDRGLFSASDARIDSIVAWVQGGDSSRRIMVAAYAGPLRPAAIPNRPYWIRNARPKLRWTALTNVLWGPVRFSVEIDGIRVALKRRTRWRPKEPLPDGAHVARITQVDGRGQEHPGLDRPVWIDTTDPKVRYKRGRLKVSDGRPDAVSGLESVTARVRGRTVTLRIRKSGRVNAKTRRPSRIVAEDEAGNRAVVSGRAAARAGRRR
jgi:hypothetical protein